MTVYRQPGVYPREVLNPIFTGIPGGVRLVGIVGTGVTYLVKKNQAVVKGATGGADVIPQLEGRTIRRVTIVGDYVDYDQYSNATDYYFASATNSIQWRTDASAEPTTGATYYVTYEYDKIASDFEPLEFDDIAAVRDNYGQELDNGIINSLPLAAYLAFQNGAPRVVCSQAQTGSNSDVRTAIDNLGKKDVDVIVCPNATNSTLRSYLRSHVLEQSTTTNRHERIAIIGFDGLSDTVSTQTAVAASMKDERITLVSPPSVTVELKDSTTQEDTEQLVTSHYSAAAYTGVLTNPTWDVAEPKTRKPLAAIKNLSTHNYTVGNMNTLGAAGVTVLVDSAGVISIRHAVTTDTTNVNTVTQSVVQIKDFIRKRMRTILDSAYIGRKLTTTTTAEVATTIKVTLEGWIQEVIINAYRDIIVSQNTVDPRQLDVAFSISAVYPIEFIDVTFSLYITG